MSTVLSDGFRREHEKTHHSRSRYELGGIPLPYQEDAVFNTLFPTPPGEAITLSGGPGTPAKTAPLRIFSLKDVPACSHCGKRRIFECQLMPHLINILRSSGAQVAQTEVERRQELQRLINVPGSGVASDEVTGLEWGTCMIFVCEADCCTEVDDKGSWEATSCWREEKVLVQWDR